MREKDSETCQIYSADLCYHCCVACILTSCMHRGRNVCDNNIEFVFGREGEKQIERVSY